MLVGVTNNPQTYVAYYDTSLHPFHITVQCRQGSSPGGLSFKQESRHSKLLPFDGAAILIMAGNYHGR